MYYILTCVCALCTFKTLCYNIYLRVLINTSINSNFLHVSFFMFNVSSFHYNIYFLCVCVCVFFSLSLCRQGNLPVALIFDYPDSNIEQDDINMLGNKYGVFIALRQKSRQSTLCIIIKGVEKNVGQ